MEYPLLKFLHLSFANKFEQNPRLMRDKHVSDTLRRPDWTHFNAFEKFGLITLFMFFAFMIFMFFILPKI
jgi:hypothetical protein